jgi:hypothetical protein
MWLNILTHGSWFVSIASRLALNTGQDYRKTHDQYGSFCVKLWHHQLSVDMLSGSKYCTGQPVVDVQLYRVSRVRSSLYRWWQHCNSNGIIIRQIPWSNTIGRHKDFDNLARGRDDQWHHAPIGASAFAWQQRGKIYWISSASSFLPAGLTYCKLAIIETPEIKIAVRLLASAQMNGQYSLRQGWEIY